MPKKKNKQTNIHNYDKKKEGKERNLLKKKKNKEDRQKEKNLMRGRARL